MRSIPAALHAVMLCAMFSAWPAIAEPLLPPRADSLYSNVLQQQRKIDVYLPQESVADSATRFETLYVLDGDWNAKIVVDIVTFIAATVERALVVDADGYYVFNIVSSEGGRLFVGGKSIAEVDGAQGQRDQTIVEPVRRGTYQLRLESRRPSKDAQTGLEVYRDEADGEWWKHRILRLSEDDGR